MAKPRVIIVTGTPGTGKTSVSRLLAEKLGCIHLDVSRCVIENRMYVSYDEERQSYVIDEDKVREAIKKLVETSKCIVIDIHYPELLDFLQPDIVIILRTAPETLERRLKPRNWPEDKVKENIMAEILGVPTANALSVADPDKIYEIDTTDKKPEEVVRIILEDILKGKAKPGPKIDWLSRMNPDELIKYEYSG